MEMIVKLSAAEADEAIAKGTLTKLIRQFSKNKQEEPVAQPAVRKTPAANEKAAPGGSENVVAAEGDAEEEGASGTGSATLPMIREILKQKKAEGKRAEIKALFGSFGAGKLPEIPEEKYPELYEKAKAL